MKILIIAATQQEITACQNHTFKNHSVDFLVTGVGIVATAYFLSKHLQSNSYELIINAGIAGCFDKKKELGTVFQVTTDSFSELGAEDGNNFISIDDLGFGKSSFKNNFKLENLASVSSITVNTVHGNQNSIFKITNRLNPTLESMEGAAVAFVCEQEKLKYLQIRSVSNYIETRNKENWNIPLAITNLNNKVIEIIESL